MAGHNYDEALRLVLKHEGGYVNHPSDPGGETNYGITKATARAHGYEGSMRSIPMGTVKAIYRKSYWDAIGGDFLPSGVDYCVFDYGVNSGVSRAKKVLQANRRASASETINAICNERMAFLKRLKTWSTFGKGWSSRVAGVRSMSLKMAGRVTTPAPPDVELPDDDVEAPEKTIQTSKTFWASIAAFVTSLLGVVTDWKVLTVLVIGAIAAYIIYERRKKMKDFGI